MSFLITAYLSGYITCITFEIMLGKLHGKEYTFSYLLSTCWISWVGVVRQVGEFEIICKDIRNEKDGEKH